MQVIFVKVFLQANLAQKLVIIGKIEKIEISEEIRKDPNCLPHDFSLNLGSLL